MWKGRQPKSEAELREELVGTFRGLIGLLVLLCTVLGVIITTGAYKDDSAKFEAEYVETILADLDRVDMSQPLDPDLIAYLRTRIERRGCTKHPVLTRIYEDYAAEMQAICLRNKIAEKKLQTIITVASRAVTPTPSTATPVAPPVVQAGAGAARAAPKSTPLKSPASPYALDIFWCESVDDSAAENALNQRIAARLHATFASERLFRRLRLRKLPKSMMTLPYYTYYGRGVTAGAGPEDLPVVDHLRHLARNAGIDLQITAWEAGYQDTYLSVFVCHNARTFVERFIVPPTMVQSPLTPVVPAPAGTSP